MSTWNVRTGQIVSINIHLLCQDGIEDVYLMSSECADKLLLLTEMLRLSDDKRWGHPVSKRVFSEF